MGAESIDQVERVLEKLHVLPVSAALEQRADALFAEAARESRSAAGTQKYAFSPRLRLRIAVVTASAAVVLVGVLLLGRVFQSTAWAGVLEAVRGVHAVHFYELKFRGSRLVNWGEGWWNPDYVKFRKSDGKTYFDDGKKMREFDSSGRELRSGKTEFENAVGRPFTLDLLLTTFSLDREEYLRQEPETVGEDFLIFRFQPRADKAKWVEQVEVTVGKGSRLPIQMKVRRKDRQDAYDLYVIDYGQKADPLEGPPGLPGGAKLGQAKGKVGERIVVRVPDSEEIEAIEVKPYFKDFGKGEVLVVDLALITPTHHRRSFAKQWPPSQTGELAGAMGDKFWPDGQFRYFRYYVRCRVEGEVVHIQAGAWFDKLFSS